MKASLTLRRGQNIDEIISLGFLDFAPGDEYSIVLGTKNVICIGMDDQGDSYVRIDGQTFGIDVLLINTYKGELHDPNFDGGQMDGENSHPGKKRR